jgi:hypothetical protein
MSVSVAIKSFQNIKNGTKHFTVYNIEAVIELKDGTSEKIVIARRYREFFNLHRQLLKSHTLVKGFGFPGKKAVGKMNKSFIESRRKKLEKYMQKVVSVSNIFADENMQNFLGVAKFFSEGKLDTLRNSSRMIPSSIINHDDENNTNVTNHNDD